MTHARDSIALEERKTLIRGPGMIDQPCGAFLTDAGKCTWTIWAPRAKNVELILFGAEGEPTRQVMKTGKYGHFYCSQDGVIEGQRYAFRLDGGPVRPDPASFWQPDGVHPPSAVWRADTFSWTDEAWRGVPLTDLVIYELHVGTFTPEGTFDAMIPRLDALRELGVTALELMPVGQFPGRRGWGYDGTYWYAVQNSYGGPRGLQRLVDACHARGLAVMLDVVYNHVGPEGNYLAEFGPYFTNRHETPWGQALNFDGAGSHGVRSFVLNNVRHWIRNFHLDGLRLDAVHAIFDDHRPDILAEIKLTAADEEPRSKHPMHIIGESNLNDVRLLDPPEQGGSGLDAQWSDDFHHCVHTLLTGEQDGYYADFLDQPRQLIKALTDVFVYDGCFSCHRGRPHGRPVKDHGGERFIVSILTHDQVGNRARGDRMHTQVPPGKQRLAAGLLLLAPHIPMLFMGEEYGEQSPFPFFCDFSDAELQAAVFRGRRAEFVDFAWPDEIPDPNIAATFDSARLSWSWPDGTKRAALRRLYRDLLSLRRTQPALQDFRNREVRQHGDDGSVLLLTRGSSAHPGQQLLAAFNLGDTVAKTPLPDFAKYELLLSSGAPRYAGEREQYCLGQSLLPHEFVVFRLIQAPTPQSPPQ